MQNTSKTNQSNNEVTIGGFRVNWYLRGSHEPEVNNNTQLIWQTKYDQKLSNKNVLASMKLVRESKKKKVDSKTLWKSVLKHRWSEDILSDSVCLSETQKYNVIRRVAAELNLTCDFESWIPDEDLAFGLELYAIVHYCPSVSVESAKLAVFFESLLSNHNLNTVVAATMHNIQPMSGDNIKDFTAVNMWYERLDKRYNFSLGPAINLA